MSGGARGGRPTRSIKIDHRDRAILAALLEHKMLSTRQVRALFFRSLRRAQSRLKDLKEAGLVSSFEPKMGFGEGRAPEHYLLTKEGLHLCARSRGVAPSELPWIPDHSYEDNQNLRHRMGVNAFFCALVDASVNRKAHCLQAWRAERWVRTRAGEVRPDGFGRYLHPGGATEFYLEYDRGTEGRGALARKLGGYLRLAAGWGDDDAAGFPSVLVVVPRARREDGVIRSFSDATRNVRVPTGLRGRFPLFVSSEELLAVRGILGVAWKAASDAPGTRRSFLVLPTKDPGPYDASRCLGREWRDDNRSAQMFVLPPPFPPEPPEAA